MIFAHDTEIALAGVAALVNTAPDLPAGSDEPEELPDVAALRAFVEEWDWSGVVRLDAEELAQVRALRGRLAALWESDRDGVVEIVNALLLETRALPQLVRHDGWDYHLHATADDDPLWMRMAVEAAMAMVDLVRAGETSRLGRCEREDCEDVLVDLTRNRSRRYCSGSCSNRAAVSAYRARRAAQA